MKTAVEIVALQAADMRLWRPAQPGTIEAYLQHALRVLHAAVDGEASPFIDDEIGDK